MQVDIKPQDPKDEFYTSEQCYITELINTPNSPDLSIAQARVEPGITTRWHRLVATTEYYYILSGSGVMELENLPKQVVKPGDIIFILPMCQQRITNTGLENLIFLAICTPRFKTNIYEEIEVKKT